MGRKFFVLLDVSRNRFYRKGEIVMVTIHLKDGKEKQFESNVALSEAAKAISNSLGKEAVVAKVDGELTDLRDPIVDGTTVEFFTKKDPEGLFTLRHTAAHVMAQAIQHLYPGVKFAIGPAIDDGFYYDIDSEHVFSQEDFDAIEREMAKISKENIPLVKKVFRVFYDHVFLLLHVQRGNVQDLLC